MTKGEQLKHATLPHTKNNSKHTNDVLGTKFLERIIAQKSWKNKHAKYFTRPQMGASKTLEKIS
jgi:hypothetical protein